MRIAFWAAVAALLFLAGGAVAATTYAVNDLNARCEFWTGHPCTDLES